MREILDLTIDFFVVIGVFTTLMFLLGIAWGLYL